MIWQLKERIEGRILHLTGRWIRTDDQFKNAKNVGQALVRYVRSSYYVWRRDCCGILADESKKDTEQYKLAEVFISICHPNNMLVKVDYPFNVITL